jgi:hypothetical protein
MNVSSENIHFSNLEFAVTENVDLGSTADALADDIPTSVMLSR